MKPDAAPLNSLCREDLEQNRLRLGLEDGALRDALLSEAELEDSLQRVLAGPDRPDGDVLLFAYGSLIWNPVIRFELRQAATALGWHRSFCLWSRINRGTPERPGLVLALDRGGSCSGLVYRIPAALAEEELRLLWRREMLLGSYVPRWVSVQTIDNTINKRERALAFVVNRERTGYAGKLPLPLAAQTVCEAHGKAGSSFDYLRMTLEGLAAYGIRDPHMQKLFDAANAYKGTAG